MTKGKFIVIDGTDGSGKATQTKLLVKALKKSGKDVEVVDFPQYGAKSAGLVEEYLNGKYGTAKEVGPYIASIFYACDRYDASFKIKSWLEEGKIVISNRYVSSNMGHQSGKIHSRTKREEYLDWLDNLEFKLFSIPRPDLTMLLYIDPITGQKWVDKKGHRDYVGGKKRDIHEADLQHLKDAADAYHFVATKYKWPIIQADQPIEKVHNDIMEIVTPLL